MAIPLVCALSLAAVSPAEAAAAGAQTAPAETARPDGPGQTRPAAPGDRVRVKLKTGYVLEGRLLSRAADSIALRLGPGQVVAFGAGRVQWIRRVQRAAGEAAAPAPGPSGPAARASEPATPAPRLRDAWFRLRDAGGRVVGTLHLLARPTEQGCRLEEQWNFYEGRQRTIVQRVEDADRRFRTRSFLYRETLLERGSGRALEERLARGRIEGERLELVEISPAGRSRRTLPFPPANRLPLAWREWLRLGGRWASEVPIYDPLEGVFELRRFAIRADDPVPEDLFPAGAPARGHARLIADRSSDRVRREWLGRDGRILLLEANGVHLVGERIPKETGMNLAAPEKARALPSFVRLASYEFWLPRATWRLLPDGPAGRRRILPPLPGAAGALRLQRAASDGELLAGAAETAVRRFGLDHPWFRERARRHVRAGLRDFIEIRGAGKDADGRPREARLYVTGSAGEGFAVLSLDLPAGGAARLGPALDDLLAGLTRPILPRPGR